MNWLLRHQLNERKSATLEFAELGGQNDGRETVGRETVGRESMGGETVGGEAVSKEKAGR